MEAAYHCQVLQRAIGAHVSARALEAITAANLGQDRLSGLFGHPEYHFDDNAIAHGLAYIEECRTRAALARSPAEAWAAFGRLTHAAQDFYSHSNYVALWLEKCAPGSGQGPALPLPWPVPETIDGLDPALLKHPRLITCRVYWPLEALWFISGLRGIVQPLLPKDSHAWMNLDSPAAGPMFPYSIEAALQRTTAEYERTLAAIGEERGDEAVRSFRDK